MTSPPRRHLPALACIAAVTGAGIWCAIGNEFSYDDAGVVVQNEFVRDWSNARHLFTLRYFEQSGELSYRPVTTLSYFVDYTVWGGGAWGYHTTNVALHVATALGLYWLLVEASATRATALVAALLFGTFPINAESICSIGFREETLLSALAVVAVGSGLRSLHGSYGWLLVAMAAAIASMFAKETGVVVPVLALAVTWHMKTGTRKGRRAVAVSALTVCALAYAYVRFGPMALPEGRAARAEWSSESSGLVAAFRTLGTYVQFLAWPPHMAVVYGAHDVLRPAYGVLFLGFALAAAIGPVVFRPTRALEPQSLSRSAGILPRVAPRSRSACAGQDARAPYGSWRLCSVGLLWCLVALIPASNLVPTGCILANRLTYLASAGFCMALATLAGARRRALAMALVPALAAMLTSRCGEWRDDPTLWRAAVRRNPSSRLALINSAISCDLAGRDHYAARLYERFLTLEPGHGKARYNLAAILRERGERSRAEEQYRRAIESDPTMVLAWCSLAKLHRENGRSSEAVRVLEQGLCGLPGSPEIHRSLGLAYRDRGDNDRALAAFTRAIEIQPTYALAHYHKARLLMGLGREAEAERTLRQALQIQPQFRPAREALGELRRRQ